MNKGLFTVALAICVIISVASSVGAHDYFDQTNLWHRGDPGTTYQAWEFPQYYSGSNWNEPNYNNNPYQQPVMNIDYYNFPDVVAGPDGTPINTIHLGQAADPNDPVGGVDLPGSIVIRIPNSPVPNPYKYIYLQITADKASLGNPMTDPGAFAVSSPGPIVGYPGGTWNTYNWLIEIHPNPAWEDIMITFPYSTNIEEIVVDTVCVVPEPGSFMALGAGVFGMAAMLRRKK